MNRELLEQVGIDVKAGLRRFVNNEALYIKMLLKFKDNTLLQELEAELEKKDANEAFQKAHALKGVCGNLSMSRLEESLRPMTETLRKGELDGVSEQMQIVRASYEEVMNVISQLNHN